MLTSLTNMMTKGPAANKLPRPARVLKVDLLLLSFDLYFYSLIQSLVVLKVLLLLFSGGRDSNNNTQSILSPSQFDFYYFSLYDQ